jgi:hypothetical protein
MALLTSSAMPMQQPPDDRPWHSERRSRFASIAPISGGAPSPAAALVMAAAAISGTRARCSAAGIMLAFLVTHTACALSTRMAIVEPRTGVSLAAWPDSLAFKPIDEIDRGELGALGRHAPAHVASRV